MKIYLDANIVIYAIEGAPGVRQRVQDRLLEAKKAGDILMTSRLTRLECRVKPLRGGDTLLLAMYDGFLGQPALRLSEVSGEVIEEATRLRSRYFLRAPDAIHVATANVEKADVILTGDAQLARCGVRVEII